jgi:glycosyltransferase involved in cell wall biosynthesis
MEKVFDDVSRFDVIHFHCDYVHFPLLRRLPCPNVTTLHGWLHAPDLAAFFDEYAEARLVSISDDQRRPVPNARWEATIHHGLPRDLHTFQPSPGEYLAFLGRISPEKRLDRAIAIARQAGMRLKVAAKICTDERGYFQETIEPLPKESASFVEFIGEVGGREKDEFLSKARALVFPIDWPEPFGLVMIEALACGTPVIAWRNGSVPEVIDDRVTGFIVDSEAEAVRAVGRVPQLSRNACRAAFEERFDAARMARNYLEVYRRLVFQAREPWNSWRRVPAAQATAARNGSSHSGPVRKPASRACTAVAERCFETATAVVVEPAPLPRRPR